MLTLVYPIGPRMNPVEFREWFRSGRGIPKGNPGVRSEGRNGMGVVLLVLLLALLFGGLGFAVHALWIVAVVLAVAWLLGFAFRSGEGHWYRW